MHRTALNLKTLNKAYIKILTPKQAGFIALPILVLILLGTAVVGGGGYTVYKVNQIEQRNADVVADLQAKIEQMATTTEETVVETATSTEMATTTENDATSTSVAIEPESRANTPTPVPVVTTPTVVDVCTNIAGIQTTLPNGYRLSGATCVQREDKCLNVEGTQDNVPTNMILTKEYGCITEADLDAIEARIASAEKAKREAEEMEEQCEDAEDELAKAEKEYAKYQKILDNSFGKPMTQEVREASVLAVGAINEISILRSSVNAYCRGVYSPATIVDYDDLMPSGPTYVNCYSSGYGSIQCTSY